MVLTVLTVPTVLTDLAVLERMALGLQPVPQLRHPKPRRPLRNSSWVLPALASWELSWLPLLCRGWSIPGACDSDWVIRIGKDER
jgi:hypothetical protein